MANFTGNKIKDTYQRVVQIDGSTLQDGLGNTLTGSMGNLTVSGTLDITGFSNVSASLAALTEFSSSLNATYATDVEVSTAVSSLNSATSSYALKTEITGSNTALSSSLASRIASQESFSSSLDATYATDAQVSTAVSSLNSATSSYALKTQISGSNTELSSSIASRISSQESFSSSLDATFATDTDLNLVSSSVDSINLKTGSFASTGSNTFTSVQVVSGSIFVSGSIDSRIGASFIIQTDKRVSLKATASGSDNGLSNLSVQRLTSGKTRALMYADIMQIGAFNGDEITIGNTSASINLRVSSSMPMVLTGSLEATGDITASAFNGSGAGLTGVIKPADTGSFAITGANTFTDNQIVSGTIDSNAKGNKIRFHYDTTGDLPSATTYHGMFAHVHGEAAAYYAHGGSWVKLADDANKVNNSATASFASTGSNTFTGNQIVSASVLLTLQPSPTLPSGVATGSLIVSGSPVQLYIFNGSGSTGWNRV